MKYKREFPDLVFRTKIRWRENHEGVSTIGELPPVEVACSPYFGGGGGKWAPQDLFVFSVNACVMTTFLSLAEEYELPFSSYGSDAEGVAAIARDGYRFVTVTIHPRIEVPDERSRKRALRLIHLSGKTCMITRSFTGDVAVVPEVTVVDGT